MQPIERYGVAALLFLIVTIGAVVLWDRSEAQAMGTEEIAAAERPAEEPRELAGFTRDRGRQDRQQPRAARHQAGSDVQAPRIQSGSWSKDREAPKLAPKPAPKPAPKSISPISPISSSARSELTKPAASKGQPVLAGGPESRPEPLAQAKRQPKGNLLEPKPRVEPAPKTRTYTVQSGDTMGVIAQNELGGVRHLAALQAANPSVVPERMSVGTVLALPIVDGAPVAKGTKDAKDAKAAKAEQQAPRPAAPASGAVTHTVREGESLWSIAEARLGKGTRYTELEALNPGAGQVLKVGQVLRLPTGAASPSSGSALAKADTQPRRTTGVVR